MNLLAKVKPSSRRSFVTTASKLTAAAALTGAFTTEAGRPFQAAAQEDTPNGQAAANPGDAAALTILLQIERRQIALYTEYIRRFGLEEATSGDRPRLGLGEIPQILSQEHRHASELEGALVTAGGNPPIPAPLVPAFGDEETFFRLAAEIEAEAVAAYTGALPTITEPEALALGLGILAVEARQAAVLGARAGISPLPEDFQPALSRQELTAFLPAPRATDGSPLLTVED